MTVKAFGAHAGNKPLEAMDIERRKPGLHDEQIDIDYCGVCHSAKHTERGEWSKTLYHCVPAWQSRAACA